ncbi:MAG TPA: phospholipase D-like domain-containing protein [bacterium]|nr:phospholipase D-like domain-containing protein [bacterium]HPP86660.1 phospholipase D-like domain-containing protein [bacterium]
MSKNDTLEFVQTVPWETNLEEQGMRHSLEVFLDLINNAKKTLDIGQFYIFSLKGQPMEQVLDALVKAADERKVKIRMVIDKFFYGMYPQGADMLNQHKGVEVRTIDYSSTTGGIMHAKYIIADDEHVYVGSTNFDWLSLTNVHEIGVKVSNKGFAAIAKKVFETDWEICKTNKMPKFKGERQELPVFEVVYHDETVKISPVASPAVLTPNECGVEIDHIVKYIDSAKNSVFLNVMEYSPKSQYRPELYNGAYDDAFRRAAARGVQIKILVSDWCLHEPNLSYIKSLSCLPNIEVKIFTIPRLKDRYLPFARVQHCKYLIIDKARMWMGSSNWEPDYFSHTRNFSLLIEGFKPIRSMRQMFLNSWTSNYAEFLDLNKVYRKPYILD